MTTAIWCMIFSGILGALSNFCMRKSMQAKGTAASFFIFQLFLTALVLTYLNPFQSGSYSLNLYTLLMAGACGLFLAILKLQIAYALQKGPSSLTFASVNSASIAPSLLLALLLVDFSYTVWNLVGSLMVVMGLLWAISHQKQFTARWSWIAFAIGAFVVQTLFLSLTECHVLLLQQPEYESLHSEWFGPLVFASAGLLHLLYYSFTQRRLPERTETFWGTTGGLLNGACSYFFMTALKIASGLEQALLFPLFSVTLIIACNLWGQWLYKEQVNWRANCLCLFGLITGYS